MKCHWVAGRVVDIIAFPHSLLLRSMVQLCSFSLFVVGHRFYKLLILKNRLVRPSYDIFCARLGFLVFMKDFSKLKFRDLLHVDPLVLYPEALSLQIERYVQP